MSPTSPHPWDGLHNSASATEVIWKFELPERTLWPEAREFQTEDEAHQAIAANPDHVVTTTPVCRFRSMPRLKMRAGRFETNVAHHPRQPLGGVPVGERAGAVRGVGRAREVAPQNRRLRLCGSPLPMR